MIQSLSVTTREIFCLEAICDQYKVNPEFDPIEAFKATTNPDTIYHHQAMKQPDREDFKDTMDKKIKDQMKNGNFAVL